MPSEQVRHAPGLAEPKSTYAQTKHGFTQETAVSLTGHVQQRDRITLLRECLESGIIKATDNESHFTKRDLVCNVAVTAQGRGIGSDLIRSYVEQQLKVSDDIIRLGIRGGELRYTTPEMLETERSMFGWIESSKLETHGVVSGGRIESVLEGQTHLTGDQVSAVRHVLGDNGSIRVMSGRAGTGKSTSLGLARKAWEAQGYNVIGCALSGMAAQALQTGSGIRSDTVAMTLRKLENAQLEVGERTIVVCDEAGMIGTKQAEALMRYTKAGTLILSGDPKQLQSIAAGGPIHEILKRLPHVELTEIIRQREAQDRKAVELAAEGKGSEFLRNFAERGLVDVAENEAGAMVNLINAWAEKGVSKPEDNVIFGSERLHARKLNALAQRARLQAGELNEDKSIKVRGQRFYEGDLVRFTKKSRYHQIENGQVGKLVEINDTDRKIVVKLKDESLRIVPLESYDHLAGGYAITTHAGQGQTVENAYLLVTGHMVDSEMTYTQVSRARGTAMIFTTVDDAGEQLSTLASRMSRSRPKELAHDVAGAEEQRLELTMVEN